MTTEALVLASSNALTRTGLASLTVLANDGTRGSLVLRTSTQDVDGTRVDDLTAANLRSMASDLLAVAETLEDRETEALVVAARAHAAFTARRLGWTAP